MNRFLSSFCAALRGIVFCLVNERNMRIHTVVVAYVLLFFRYFTLTRGEIAFLFIAFGLVIGAEMLNSAIEGLTDMLAPKYSGSARNIKDIAAGAVLVCALFSLCVAICLFWQPDAWHRIVQAAGSPFWLAGFVLLTGLFAVYIWKGPRRLIRWLSGKKRREKEKKENL